jgi:hypothetical protein
MMAGGELNLFEQAKAAARQNFAGNFCRVNTCDSTDDTGRVAAPYASS